MTELIALPFSPWSEKARWALDVRRVPYRYRRYQPILGELELRRKARRWRGPVTVPVLVDDTGFGIMGSGDIARWANGRGEGPSLFPDAEREAIDRWVERSEDGLAAGRALSLRRVLDDEEAVLELAPKALRGGALRAIGVAGATLGVRRTLRKYEGAGRSDDEARAALVAVLDALRAALAAGGDGGASSLGAGDGPRTLVAGFTFADIAMTQVLAFVDPPTFGLRLGPASRRSFTDPDLRTRYADLLAWRDAVYARHRPRS